MAGPRLAERLRAGETVYCGWSGLAEPLAGEALARAGFDAVCLDLQHGFQDFRAFREGVTAIAGAGAAPIARVPYGGFPEIGRALDCGAEAVICPMLNSRADVERFVTAMKFPPVGARSWGPHRVAMLWGMETEDFLARANDLVIGLAMVETVEAVDRIEEILAVPGIDGIFVGPNDLAISVFGGRHLDHAADEVWAALEVIAERARAYGKHAAIYANTPDLAARYREMGYRLIASGSDLAMLRAGARTLLEALRAEA